MSTTAKWDHQTLALEVNGASLELDTLVDPQAEAPGAVPARLRFDQGGLRRLRAHPRTSPLGGSSLSMRPASDARSAATLARVSIEFLVDVADAVLKRLAIEEFHVVGHSMGGLTALMLAQRAPDRVLSFVNIEGNLAFEDCFLSRQIIDTPADDPAVFLEEFAARTHLAPEFSSTFYASSVQSRVRPDVVRGVLESMVDLSDHGNLLSSFTALAMPPAVHVCGKQIAGLSYLPLLEGARRGVGRDPLERALADVLQSRRNVGGDR